MTIKKVDIRPGISILAVLRHLNYKPWFALGEFVDNSVQSFVTHRPDLMKFDPGAVKLRVDIDIDPTPPSRIAVRDNAAGISPAEFPRAFRPAAIPPDRSGLAEFGMGMKSAACWFAPKWSVRTKALGDSFVRTVQFDIENIVNDNIGELAIREDEAPLAQHFTEVTLDQIFHVPVRRTIAKIKEHLTDIYRCFIRDGLLELRFNGDTLIYDEPPVLCAPYFKEKGGAPKLWRKSIDFDFGGDLSVHGFAALRETASVARAGFALFRRGRLIEGSGDEGYRPAYIISDSL